MLRTRLPSLDRVRLALGAIVAAAFAFRVWGITWGLQNADISRRPHPDEWPVYWLFRWFNQTHSLNPCPRAPKSCFFDWGAVFPYAAYGMHAILQPLFSLVPAGTFGPRADLVFVYDDLSARATSVLFSTLAVVVVYLIGRDAFSPGIGLLSAALVAFATLPIQLAHFGTPDSTSLLLVSLVLWRCVCLRDDAGSRNIALTGGLIGLATGSEYQLGMLVLPLLAALLLSGSWSWRGATWAVFWVVAVFLASNPYSLIDAPGFIAATKHTLQIRTVDSGVAYQGRFNSYGPGWLYVVRLDLGYGVTLPVALWFVAGAAAALWRRSRSDLVLLAWIVPYFVLISVSPAKFMRYSDPLLPGLAVLGAVLAFGMYDRARLRGRPLVVAVAAAAMVYAAVYDLAYAGLFSTQDPRTVATQDVLSQPGHDSGIAFEELPDGLVNLPYFVDGLAPRTCFADFKTGHLAGATYLMTDEYSAEEHPRIGAGAVQTFLGSLRSGGAYKLVARVSYTPTFLGMTFPLSGSPHDWRYPLHEISIYRVPGPLAARTAGSQCYPSVAAAAKVLYPRLVERALLAVSS